MDPLTRAYWTAKGVGWDNLPRRILQAWRVRSGYLSRCLDPERFSDRDFCVETGFHEPIDDAIWRRRFQDTAKRGLPVATKGCLSEIAGDETLREKLLAPCESALAGEYLFFGHWYGRLGWPPDFNLDPCHNIRYPVEVHCQKTARSGPPRNDVKLVWEASRLSMACYFARAYAYTGNPKWAEAFWQMFGAWVEQNPPQLSAAWGCSQETAFRLIAVVLAAGVTWETEAATPELLCALYRFAWQAGKSIEANINYALSQKNNHGISESVALWTLGLLFREWPAANRWKLQGRDLLEKEICRQIYSDGSFVQHSMNYHRVMLDDLLWALRLGQLNGESLADGVMDRFERATQWLAEMVDRESGRVPNYGPNDGAQVLPLSCCDYLDYRPVLQACWYLGHGTRFFAPGPWDEKMVWVSGEGALGAPVRPSPRTTSFTARNGGYHILRGPRSWCMTRCHTYRDRPAEADMLHVDLWHEGANVARDGGSYHYYTTDPVGPFFKSTAAHNTVQVDRMDQMTKGPRFLWFHWTKSRVLSNCTFGGDRAGFFSGEHSGYCRLRKPVRHRRSILRVDDMYLVVDDLTGDGSHDVTLRWRLRPNTQQGRDLERFSRFSHGDYDVAVFRPEGAAISLLAGQEVGPYVGWESLYYGEKRPVPTVCLDWSGCLPLTLVTLFGNSLELTPFLETLGTILPLEPLRLPPELPQIMPIQTDQWTERTADRFRLIESG